MEIPDFLKSVSMQLQKLSYMNTDQAHEQVVIQS